MGVGADGGSRGCADAGTRQPRGARGRLFASEQTERSWQWHGRHPVRAARVTSVGRSLSLSSVRPHGCTERQQHSTQRRLASFPFPERTGTAPLAQAQKPALPACVARQRHHRITPNPTPRPPHRACGPPPFRYGYITPRGRAGGLLVRVASVSSPPLLHRVEKRTRHRAALASSSATVRRGSSPLPRHMIIRGSPSSLRQAACVRGACVHA